MNAKVAYLVVAAIVGLVLINVIGSAVAYGTQQRDVDIVKRLSGDPRTPRIYMPEPKIVKSGKKADVYFEDEIPPTMRPKTTEPHAKRRGHHGKSRRNVRHAETKRVKSKDRTAKRGRGNPNKAENGGGAKNGTAETEPFFTKNM
ncbi:MAG: hypothetical protein NVSMB14_14020 [Isosphaeraceae bacterium]